ncbi:hypothetical protein AX769_05075 [Frondihabitans sp. PAMC 28766]|uniref:winged helix-turn-helix domain-containing protein n=1 Tax=Frondihabitans sp. PAMC 28766 TaxID=1795630 RepID=UPI00078BFE4A|nr:winged helix-turn-helix domain-containing protein [Frondihabitans sp. PAMC 28766]AMM19627.1 hypothetical protein AX769_05075 [Frondihabitans sp. PAMC 28766]
MRVARQIAPQPELDDAAFINTSVTRRRIVTELHVAGPLTFAELLRATGRSPRRLRSQLRSLVGRGLVGCTAPEQRRRPQGHGELYSLAA